MRAADRIGIAAHRALAFILDQRQGAGHERRGHPCVTLAVKMRYGVRAEEERVAMRSDLLLVL